MYSIRAMKSAVNRLRADDFCFPSGRLPREDDHLARPPGAIERDARGGKRSGMTPGTGSLNGPQAIRLRVTCQHIDSLLCEIEKVLDEPASGTAFPRYSQDITGARRLAIDDFIARIRASLVGILETQDIAREQTPAPASRAIALTLVSIDIAVEELKPKYMRCYGDVPAAAGRDLNKITKELHGLAAEFAQYLAEGHEEGPGNPRDGR